MDTHRAAYVNGMKHNLINISQLCDANFEVLFTKTQGTIFNQNNEVVLIAPRIRDVYVIDMSSYNEESNACFFAKASNSVNWLWHKRLSHLNFKNINKLARQNLVAGLPSLTFSKDKTCSACKKGKHYRASFKTKRSFSISKCLNILHIDLFRLVKPQIISHNKYALVIVDEYSRYTWVFFLKKKSDAADCIMSFITKMENLNEVRVKELRSDNRTEFKNHKLEEFYDEKGISQNFSSPYTPKQNGVAERRNRTLTEVARTISIIVKRHRKTSYDVFRGRSPDISYFHVFGCPVHIHNHKDHLGKFDAKDDDGLFLGYSLVAKAFRGDEINFNKNSSFPDDEFLVPRNKVSQCSGNDDYFPYVPTHDPFFINNISISNNVTPSETPILQDFNSFDEHPEFTIADDHPVFNEHDDSESVEDLGIVEDQAGVTTRRRTRDSEAASAHECLDVNFLSEIEPKKLIEALEEEGWIIAMQ
ncbi:retrovirus-related pol polyprotein from transposon TNT 1-94 [Tanacetum coccineum]